MATSRPHSGHMGASSLIRRGHVMDRSWIGRGRGHVVDMSWTGRGPFLPLKHEDEAVGRHERLCARVAVHLRQSGMVPREAADAPDAAAHSASAYLSTAVQYFRNYCTEVDPRVRCRMRTLAIHFCTAFGQHEPVNAEWHIWNFIESESSAVIFVRCRGAGVARGGKLYHVLTYSSALASALASALSALASALALSALASAGRVADVRTFRSCVLKSAVARAGLSDPGAHASSWTEKPSPSSRSVRVYPPARQCPTHSSSSRSAAASTDLRQLAAGWAGETAEEQKKAARSACASCRH